MAADDTRTQKFGNVVKHEYEPGLGYCRKLATVTLQSGMDIGAVLYVSSGKYVWCAAANVASAAAILIDGDAIDTGAGDATMAILYRGPAIIAKEQLDFADSVTSGNIATAVAALQALGISCETSL